MIKYLLGVISVMLMLVGFSKAAIKIEDGDSKLVVDGFLSIYADSGNKVGDIGDTYTQKNNVSRLNFAFSHKESDSLTSVGYISIGIDPLAEYGSDSQFLAKYRSYVGLEHNTWGKLYIGTVTSPNYQIIGWTDIGIGYTGDANSEWANGDRGQKRGLAYAEDAIYYGKNFAFTEKQSLDIYLQTQAAEAKFSQGLRRKNANSAGIAYNLGKFSIGFAGVGGTFEQESSIDEISMSELSVGLRFKGEKLYLAATATAQDSITKVDVEKTGLELAADYKIGSGYGLIAIYNLRQVTSGEYKDMNDLNYINLLGYKNLSDNFKVYVMLTFDLRTDEEKDNFVNHTFEGNTDDNSISFGFKYYF